MNFLYLGALLASLGAMVLLDRRYRLFFWAGPGRAVVVLGVGLVFFLAWDLFGIGLGIFRRGETEFMTGLHLAPELPLEELFFLVFLCYLTMNLVTGVYRALGRALGRAPRRAPGRAPGRRRH
ncbi:lycopene cyclase domain-containing protein [Glaciibacter sp. 2TAF33]|uniref:lycopene cyclase domain-containing protein n=1 Tax=Glaciibacter sp. 2TAF33 TaxID=3233015 RepID=UPI003F8E7277